MKALLIVLFAGFGFLSLYALNPNYVDLPFIGGILFSGIGMGCCVGYFIKQSKTRLLRKSLIKANEKLTKDVNELAIENLDHKIEISRLKSKCFDLMEECESFQSLRGNFAQLQKRYNRLKEEIVELGDYNTYYNSELVKKDAEIKHLKEAISEQSKMMNVKLSESSIPEFDSTDIESQLNDLNIR